MSDFQNSDDEYLILGKRLLELGADTKLVNVAGDTSLIKAVRAGDFKRVKQILEHSTDSIGMPDNDGNTPLMIATSNGEYKIAHLLLDYTANINILNKFGEDAYMCLKSRKHKSQAPENDTQPPPSSLTLGKPNGSRWGKLTTTSGWGNKKTLTIQELARQRNNECKK